jgi:hypothetical protein
MRGRTSLAECAVTVGRGIEGKNPTSSEATAAALGLTAPNRTPPQGSAPGKGSGAGYNTPQEILDLHNNPQEAA